MNWNHFNRGALFEEAGTGAGTGGAGGTGQPGGAASNPGTGAGAGDQPKFVTEETFGKTAAMIRKLSTTVEGMQGSAVTLDKLAEVGLFEKVEEDGKVVYKPKTTAAPAKPEKKADDDPLVLRVKALEGQLAKANKEKEEADRRVEEDRRNRELTLALEKAGAVKADRDYVHLVPKLVKGSDGTWVVPGKDQHGFDKEFTLEEYADLFLKENPELRKAQGQGGSGTPTGSTAVGGMINGKPIIPKAQWTNPVWYAANRDKVMKQEVVLGD